MDKREEFKEISNNLKEANQKYWDYMEQFFSRGWENSGTQSQKSLNLEEIEKIKILRSAADKARQALEDFFGIR